MGIQMTASCSFGKTAIGHDNRVFIPGNVDPGLSKNNEYLIRCQTLRDAYDGIFTDAVKEYNSKQKRKDRKIASYYDKIRDSKNGEHLAYEYVLQVGSRESNPTGGEYEEISKEIYREWLEAFTKGQDNLKVINASVHCDEPNGTPHMHITIVPVAHYSRGLSLRNSMSGAMKEMGYARAADWCLDIQMQLGRLLQEKGIEYVKLGTHREHIENGLFQELMDKEQARVAEEISEITAELESLKEEQAELRSGHDDLKAKNKRLMEENNSLMKRNARLSVKEKLLSNDLEKLDSRISEKRGILKRLEEKINTLLTSARYKIREYTNDLTVRNTQKRIEKTLEHMTISSANDFRFNWNRHRNEYPCFNLKYVQQESRNGEEKLTAIPQDLKDSYLADVEEFIEGEAWDLSL